MSRASDKAAKILLEGAKGPDWFADATKVKVTVKFPGSKAVVFTGYQKMSIAHDREVLQHPADNTLYLTGRRRMELRMWSEMEEFDDYPREKK